MGVWQYRSVWIERHSVYSVYQACRGGPEQGDPCYSLSAVSRAPPLPPPILRASQLSIPAVHLAICTIKPVVSPWPRSVFSRITASWWSHPSRCSVALLPSAVRRSLTASTRLTESDSRMAKNSTVVSHSDYSPAE